MSDCCKSSNNVKILPGDSLFSHSNCHVLLILHQLDVIDWREKGGDAAEMPAACACKLIHFAAFFWTVSLEIMFLTNATTFTIVI